MGLSGQWVSRYAGSNSGTIVIDIDDMGDRYRGVACVWDDNSQFPSSLVRFITESKSNKHKLNNVRVVPMDTFGNIILPEAIEQATRTSGFRFPDVAEIEIDLKGASLSVTWNTSVQTNGATSASAPKTRGDAPSDLKRLPISSWDGFKQHVDRMPPKRFVFRGQENNKWRLRTSFHRTGRANLERFLVDDVKDLQRAFSAVTAFPFNLTDGTHYGAFLNLAQHHGYPTPMLDWTWSPYVAAFFAFRNIRLRAKGDGGRKVRIYKLNAHDWNLQLPRFDKVFPVQPHVSLLEPLAIGNVRAVPQQAISTITNVDDIESHIQMIEGNANKTFLEVIDLPVTARPRVMQDLALMGITAGSLFPGLDGACESLRERNF